MVFWTLHNLLPAAEVEKEIRAAWPPQGEAELTACDSLSKREALAAELKQAMRPELNSFNI